MVNKALGRDPRNMMDQQREKHQVLVDIEINQKKRLRYTNPQIY